MAGYAFPFILKIIGISHSDFPACRFFYTALYLALVLSFLLYLTTMAATTLYSFSLHGFMQLYHITPTLICCMFSFSDSFAYLCSI